MENPSSDDKSDDKKMTGIQRMTKSKNKAVALKDNEAKGLQNSKKLDLAKKVNQSIAAYFNLSKAMQVGILCHQGHDAKDCAIIAQTSVDYCHNIMRDYRTKPKFRERVLQIVSEFPDMFRTSKQADLPILDIAQKQAIQYYLDNPTALIDRPQLAKQIATQAGVKSDEDRSPRMVNIRNLLVVQGYIARQQGQYEQVEVIDAEEIE